MRKDDREKFVIVNVIVLASSQNFVIVIVIVAMIDKKDRDRVQKLYFTRDYDRVREQKNSITQNPSQNPKEWHTNSLKNPARCLYSKAKIPLSPHPMRLYSRMKLATEF